MSSSHTTTWVSLILIFIQLTESAISPPPWVDSVKNPCTNRTGGWQLIYWEPLKDCFKIFQVGYPCPDTMELGTDKYGYAKCWCPPGTAEFNKTSTCHKLFEQGPCELGQYFAPVPYNPMKYAM